MSSKLAFGQYLEWSTDFPPKGQIRESPIFFLRAKKWTIQFTLDDPHGHFYELHLVLKDEQTDFESFSCRCDVTFENKRYESLLGRSFTIFHPSSTIIQMDETEIQKILPSDYVTGNWILFRFHFDSISEPLLQKKDDKSVQTPSYIDTKFSLEDISKKFAILLDEDKEHDIEFKCGGDTIRAHKNILCYRSSVFASMLRTDMVEGKTGRVKIEDMDGAFFKQFLKYLYTGALPELTLDTALQFYEASDKYAVDVLKKQCASFLLDNLTPHNACEVLIVADQHNDADFKKDVMEYMIKEKVPRIAEEWTFFCQDNPSLANEVLNLAFQKLC